MHRSTRYKRLKKIIALTLALSMLNATLYPTYTWALGSGVGQPEYASFEPVDATDMVNLLTGDFTYSLPILNVPGLEGGYPLSLFYHAGIKPEQEASWVGLGWNINPGSINRFAKGVPDDWNNKTTSVVSFNEPNTDYDWAASVSYSFAGAASVGISLDGGSYKSMGGSVNASYGKKFGAFSVGGGASIGTGGVGVGGGIGVGGAGISAGAGVDWSGNVRGNASVGISHMASIGVSLSTAGTAGYASFANQTVGLSTNAISNNDMSIKTFSAMATIPLVGGNLWLGLSYNHYKYWLWKMFEKHNYGSLYMKYVSTGAGAAQASTSISDSYDNPYNSSTYNNGQQQAQSNSLSFPNYDGYQVSGQGIGGNISPKIYEYAPMTREAIIYSRFSNFAAQFELEYYNDYAYSFTKDPNRIYFQFDYDQGGYSRIVPGTYSAGNTNPPDYTYSGGTPNYINPDNKTFYNTATQRAGKSKYIEYFTNAQIASKSSLSYSDAVGKGFIESESQIDQRGNPDLYDPHGIGAFSITAEDGKTYHYSVPVYQFEEFQVFEQRTNPHGQYLENRKLNMYAYDWLLTSVTGPDYLDRGTIGVIDDLDWGYWVQFDYGKWTDGYVWRSPHQDNTWSKESADQPYGAYSFGRKQIYYLNDVKTKTHTAYFIKSLRKDGIGKDMDYSPDNTYHIRNGEKYIGSQPTNCSAGLAFATYILRTQETEKIKVGEANQQLKLDKIILLNNADAAPFASTLSGDHNGTSGDGALGGANGNTLKTSITNGHFYILNRTEVFDDQGRLVENCDQTLHDKYFTSYFQENVLDWKDVKDVIVDIEKKAVKVIEFNQNYSLCGGTPNSIAVANSSHNSSGTVQGKLTLNSVKIYGKGKADILPSYNFAYNNQLSNPISYNKDNMDNWGYYSTKKEDYFNKPNADAWSLNEITTPLGGKIKINYETDSYSREAAFAGSLESALNVSGLSSSSSSELRFKLTENISNLNPIISFTINNYYKIEYLQQAQGTPFPFGQAISYTGSNKLLSINLGTNELTFQVNTPYVTYRPDLAKVRVNNDYNLGGGIRVKEILLDDGLGNNYKTSYFYDFPSFGGRGGGSSGVTSFAPRTEDRYIPYVYELPGPMVMYEYVTVEDKGLTNDSYLKTRYKFDVLKTAQTSPNFSMGDHFKVEDIQPSVVGNIQNYTTGNHFAYTYARSGVITDNKAAIGRILEVATLNKANLVQDKVTYQYQTPSETDIKNGITQETFNDIKRYIRWDEDHVTSSSTWYITSSSRIVYPSVLKSITSESNGIKNTTTNTKYDFYTGVATETESVNPSGEKYRTKTIPAYAEYGGIQTGMGSKVYDVLNNKNMLVQETSSKLYSVDANNTESLISANVQTWNNWWNYREYLPAINSYATIAPNDGTFYASGNAYQPIWRKYQSYVWKSLNNSDGTAATFTDYVWGTTTQNAGWQKTNEVTRYNHNSQALEAKDINNRIVSTKFGYNDRFPIASAANAKYGSFAFSGAEDAVDGTDYFGGEVAGTGLQSNLFAHTGNYSIALAQKDAGFIYTGTIGNLASNDFKKGQKMRASVWVYNQNPNTGRLIYDLIKSDGSPEVSGYVDVSSASSKLAGNWYLLTLDFYIPVNTTATTLSVYASHIQDNFSSLPIYFDDFRVHPQEAVMTSTVYDETTGWVKAVLDADNFATKFTYDAAGRLIRTDKETLQGFKKVSENTYHYGRP